MARPFDARALVGRTFGSVLDEIAPGWRLCGFGPSGPFVGPFVLPLSEERRRELAKRRRELAEISREFAPVDGVLRAGGLVLVSVDGKVVPQSAWLAGQWGFYDGGKYGSEGLKERAVAGQEIGYFIPRFADPAQGRDAGATKQKLAYGEASRTVREAMTTHAKALAGIKSRSGRAAFLANKVGCSKSLADQVLKDEEK